MSILNNIKLAIATKALQTELESKARVRQASKFSFADTRTVGILFDASSAEDYELVKRYVIYLKEHFKKVKVIGYFSAKDIPALTYSKLEYDFLSQKELNWFGKPNSVIIDNFMNGEYDLLIDLNINNHFPLHYICALSKAKFKVGSYSEKDIEIYDMMIDSDNTKTLKYFLRQVDTYISMMNSKVEILKDQEGL